MVHKETNKSIKLTYKINRPLLSTHQQYYLNWIYGQNLLQPYFIDHAEDSLDNVEVSQCWGLLAVVLVNLIGEVEGKFKISRMLKRNQKYGTSSEDAGAHFLL